MEKPNTKLEEMHTAYMNSVMEGGDKDEQGDSTNRQLGDKMEDIKKEIFAMKMDPYLFKNHQLPLARIKKIMKSDEDVRMISSETPVLFAKACYIFIIELTHRAWAYTEEAKRRTLQKSDIASCIENTEIFDFLIDIIPKEDLKSKKQEAPPNLSNYQLNYGKGIELYQKAQSPNSQTKK